MIRVRIAPSPTGKLHLGTARTALFNFLFARKNKGRFILRFEDTDRARSTKESEEDILENLKWLGLKWDEGPYYQMERLPRYQKYLQKLLKEGLAYFCYCTPEELAKERQLQEAQKQPPRYSGRCKHLSASEIRHLEQEGRKPAIRLDVEKTSSKLKLGKEIVFNDLLHGDIRFNLANLGDFIIVKSDGIPIFHFANVVDDGEMGITHIIRGEEHISNTPKQILLQKALGFTFPFYLHLPLILNPDRTKMSKRFGDVDVTSFRQKGYLPEAIVNYLATLGWYPADSGILTLKEMIEKFELRDLQKSPAVFYQDKLNWFNNQWIKQLSNQELQRRIKDLGYREIPLKIIEIIKERMKTLNEVPFWTNFFFQSQTVDKKELCQKIGEQKTKLVLQTFLKNLQQLPAHPDKIKEGSKEIATKMNLGLSECLAPVRLAITYSPVSPPLFESMAILGKKEYLRRLELALKVLES